MARITYKPYAAGIVFHAVIEAALALDVAPDDVAGLLVEGDALLLARGDREVRTERDARVSIHHAAALGIVRRRAGVADFEMPAVEDPALSAFRARVQARCDPALPRGAARLTATLRDGTCHSRLVIHPSGSQANPMSDTALDDKFRENLRIAGIPERADGMIAALRGLEGAANLDGMGTLLI